MLPINCCLWQKYIITTSHEYYDYYDQKSISIWSDLRSEHCSINLSYLMKEDPINKLHPIKDKSRICMKNNSKKSMIYRTKKSSLLFFFLVIRKYEHICFESGNDTYQPNVYLWRNLLFSAPIILQSNYCAQKHLL